MQKLVAIGSLSHRTSGHSDDGMRMMGSRNGQETCQRLIATLHCGFSQCPRLVAVFPQPHRFLDPIDNPKAGNLAVNADDHHMNGVGAHINGRHHGILRPRGGEHHIGLSSFNSRQHDRYPVVGELRIRQSQTG